MDFKSVSLLKLETFACPEIIGTEHIIPVLCNCLCFAKCLFCFGNLHFLTILIRKANEKIFGELKELFIPTEKK